GGKAGWGCAAAAITSPCWWTDGTGWCPTAWRRCPTGWVGWWRCSSYRSVGRPTHEVRYGQDQLGSGGSGRAPGGGGAEHRGLCVLRRNNEAGYRRGDAGARQAGRGHGQSGAVVRGARLRDRHRIAMGVCGDPAALRGGGGEGGER